MRVFFIGMFNDGDESISKEVDQPLECGLSERWPVFDSLLLKTDYACKQAQPISTKAASSTIKGVLRPC
ncbi:hypothetical protein GCM10027046_07180 [Uliginosibacterium flavum]